MGVVLVVVGLAPVGAGADDVPLVGLRVQARIVHPVVLAMNHVVADLHVLEDLGHRQGENAQRPQDGIEAEEQGDAAAQGGQALDAHDAADVAGIALAQIIHDAGAQGIKLGGEGGFLVRAQAAAQAGGTHGL